MIIDTTYERELERQSHSLTSIMIRVVALESLYVDYPEITSIKQINEMNALRMSINEQDEQLRYEMKLNRC